MKRDVSTDRLHGVLPVLQTPFLENGDIDFEVLESEASWVLENGADGVVVGMVSEVLRLSDRERDDLAGALGGFAERRGTHFVMSVGAESTRVAIENARRAEAHGATEVMAIPPIAVVLAGAETLRYYEDLINAISIPVVVQDASGYVGAPMSISTMAALHVQFEDRVVFKPEAPPLGPRLTELRDSTGGAARIFEGTGGLSLIDSYRRGIAGTMPGSDLCWAISRMWRALKQGNFETAYAIQGPLLALITIQTSLGAFLAVEKHLLVKQGVFRNSICREPRGFFLDPETKQEVDRAFHALARVCEYEPGPPT